MAKFTRVKEYEAEQWFPGNRERDNRLKVGQCRSTNKLYSLLDGDEWVAPGVWFVTNDKGETKIYPDAEFRAKFTPSSGNASRCPA